MISNWFLSETNDQTDIGIETSLLTAKNDLKFASINQTPVRSQTHHYFESNIDLFLSLPKRLQKLDISSDEGCLSEDETVIVEAIRNIEEESDTNSKSE